MEGLEPPRLSAPDPKSGTATNYATCAFHEKGLKKLNFDALDRKRGANLFIISSRESVGPFLFRIFISY